MHPHDQLRGLEGLRDVVVRAQLEPEPLVDQVVLGREHDDGEGYVSVADGGAHLEAAVPLHHHIKDDQVHPGPGVEVQGLHAVFRLDDLEALPPHADGNHLADAGVVVDDEYRLIHNPPHVLYPPMFECPPRAIRSRVPAPRTES